MIGSPGQTEKLTLYKYSGEGKILNLFFNWNEKKMERRLHVRYVGDYIGFITRMT